VNREKPDTANKWTARKRGAPGRTCGRKCSQGDAESHPLLNPNCPERKVFVLGPNESKWSKHTPTARNWGKAGGKGRDQQKEKTIIVHHVLKGKKGCAEIAIEGKGVF